MDEVHAAQAALGHRRGLRDCSELYQFWSYGRGTDSGRDIVAEHREIADHALARAEDAAVAALTHHIQRTTDSLIDDAGRMSSP